MADASDAEVSAVGTVPPFVGDSEMAARLAAFDWSASVLGPVADWPQSLRTAVGICLSSRYPMAIWWGPELVLLYNDAWIPIPGPEKHPAHGRPGAEVWPEVWHIIGSQLRSVLETGNATFSDDQLLPIQRLGYLEESYFTYSYSAIREENGAVGGVFTAVTETTQQILSERRLRTLRALGESATLVRTQSGATLAAVYGAALQFLADDRADIPFAAVFAVGPGQALNLVCDMGLADSSVLSASQSELLSAVSTGQPMTFIAIPASWAQAVLPGANPVDDQPPASAAVMPVQLGDDGSAAAVLVAAVTPHRCMDDEFRGFLGLVATQISRAVSDTLAYQAQRRRAEALAELDKAKSEFFANVSHEFRTPLTLIAGPAEDSLLDTNEPLGSVQRERLDVIRRNAGRLRRLVDDLLEFATIEAGKRAPQREFVDLAAATRELVASFAPAMTHAGLDLRCSIEPMLRPVSVDVSMWEKIVLNLLSNAVKYTPAGHIAVRLQQCGDVVRLSVTDTGIGIPSDELPKVFERFHRVRGRTGRSYEGAGIGLALVAELVHLLDGTIEVQSQENAGSTFTVELPYATTSAAVVPADRLAARPSSYRAYLDEALQWPRDPAATGASADTELEPSSDAPCVLVVEDNADMRAFVSDVLAPHWRVLEAPDGLAGLALARQHCPDLVLTDVMMPRLDGFGLLAELRSDPRTATTPVVFLSARASEESAVGGLDAGADDYLAKPFSTVELLARVRSNLEMARLRNREAEFRRALIDSMQEGFFLTDEDGTVVEANHAFFELTGYDAAGLPYRWPQPWIPAKESEPDAWAVYEESFIRSVHRGGGRFTLPVRHRDGHRLWVACSSAVITDPRSQRRLVIGTAVDVTTERLANQRDEILSQFAVAIADNRTTSALLSTATEQLGKLFGALRTVVAHWSSAAAAPALVTWPLRPLTGDQDLMVSALQSARHRAAASVATFPQNGYTVIAAPLDGTATAAVAMQFGSNRPVRGEDRELFALLTSHLAQALLTAREFEKTRAVALALQQAILGPTVLPHGFAVRYAPAEEPLKVGGDWYDVVALGDDRIGVVVGDCVGHGLAAAAVMGQLRSAARALLISKSTPATVLEGLDLFARAMPGALCTTVFCAVIDLRASAISYSSAGHPPPILVSADGERQLLDAARSLPLAVASAGIARTESSTRLAAGSTLLLYTDGLIERRGESLDTGIDRATTALTGYRCLHPDEIGDRLMDDLSPPAGYDDDVAVLLYRHPPQPLRVRLPAVPISLRAIRERLRSWLPAAGFGADVVGDVLLAVGEAAANAVEHATRDADHDVELTVTMEVTSAAVAITVIDNGRWQPPAASSGNRGHGINLMKALVDLVAVTPAPSGTTVVLVKKLVP